MMNTTNIINISYTKSNIIQIMMDTIGLYLIIKKDNENRAKLTIKTILMSLYKNDINVFYRYYDIFTNTLFKIKKDNILNNEDINIREVALALLTQIKLIVDSYNDNNILKDIIEKCFSNLNNKNFYLFKLDNSNYITNINQIENNKIELFIETIKDIISNSAIDVYDRLFGYND